MREKRMRREVTPRVDWRGREGSRRMNGVGIKRTEGRNRDSEDHARPDCPRYDRMIASLTVNRGKDQQHTRAQER